MDVEREGWVSTGPVVDPALLDTVIAELPTVQDAAGARNILSESGGVRALARAPAVRSLAESVLSSACFVVRGIFFDKTPTSNWKVMWHQDLSIAVRERRDAPGFGPWSEKAGVTHVQPPAELLGRMLAVRVHLDDCTEENGPVRVLPGTHREGRLTAQTIEHFKATIQAVTCTVPRGGLLAFRPLLLHASSPALHPMHRRVVHFEFAAEP
ncbi:MAG TPA: phytanoyl-CoA dioxygenase family protein [Gemmatimonadaceae bacterium]|nr:phytanoyl-CoA dioxygenase family protein [Gemmatimonadaceae bacterium]